jgi:hypothetical protein
VLLVVGTVATCFLAYEGIRRVRWLRPLLGLSLRGDSATAPPPSRVVPAAAS